MKRLSGPNVLPDSGSSGRDSWRWATGPQRLSAADEARGGLMGSGTSLAVDLNGPPICSQLATGKCHHRRDFSYFSTVKSDPILSGKSQQLRLVPSNPLRNPLKPLSGKALNLPRHGIRHGTWPPKPSAILRCEQMSCDDRP